MAEYLKLKPANCKNCYKCIRNCPVKSIRFSNNQAYIISEACILCGRCFVVCPQNAKEIRSDTDRVQRWIAAGETVVASLAPSFAAAYPGANMQSMKNALIRLGFADAEETALGAAMVKQAYDDMVKTGAYPVLISSCCPTVNLLIQKHYTKALPCLAPVVTPMQAHCMDLKRRFPQARTVFVGPCISKKSEADDIEDVVDCALTFEELSLWMAETGTALTPAEETVDTGRTRIFPTAGGILKSMRADAEGVAYITVDGIENCIQAIEDVISGDIGRCFIEMSACAGSCTGGPVIDKHHHTPIKDYMRIAAYANEKDFDVHTEGLELACARETKVQKQVTLSETLIADVLRQMGKTRPEDELNCGSCGYNTCREKAKAVLEGKATLEMCLPYLKEKAESFSDNIISHTPTAIIVLNEQLEVQQLNAAACGLMHIDDVRAMLGQPVVRILDPRPFKDVLEQRTNRVNERVYLVEYQKYVEQSLIYDHSYRIIICLMRDITEEVRHEKTREAMSQTTIDITDRMIEKQMRAVQEIASLLGETTAETKIALNKLKETLTDV